MLTSRPALAAVVFLAACSGEGSPSDSGLAGDAGDGADGGGGADADGDGITVAEGDCDDTNAEVFPGAPERCNGVDDDCSGAPHPLEGPDGADCADCQAGGWWGEARSVADQGNTRDALVAVLASAWDRRVCEDYDFARERLFTYESGSTGSVTGIYTGARVDVSDGVDFNVVNPEHAWPRSDGADGNPRECDLHHLFVATASANTRRGNHPFGLVTDAVWSEGGSVLGDSVSGERVFEPRAEVRGDLARAMLYFAARYGSEIDGGALAKHGQTALYLGWHADDPVTETDATRSVALGGAQQGRANPFVVCSGWAELWAGAR